MGAKNACYRQNYCIIIIIFIIYHYVRPPHTVAAATTIRIVHVCLLFSFLFILLWFLLLLFSVGFPCIQQYTRIFLFFFDLSFCVVGFYASRVEINERNCIWRIRMMNLCKFLMAETKTLTKRNGRNLCDIVFTWLRHRHSTVWAFFFSLVCTLQSFACLCAMCIPAMWLIWSSCM